MGDRRRLVDFIDDELRPAGYPIISVVNGRESEALAERASARPSSLAWGPYLYVEDVSTLPSSRRSGHGERLMDWLAEEARRLGCEEFHLDSCVFAAITALQRQAFKSGSSWGNEWGNMTHRFQPISADLDFVKTALNRAPHSPAGLLARAHNWTVLVGTRRSNTGSRLDAASERTPPVAGEGEH
jgi:GNAT superfamily N-acetyltransferase